MNTLKEKLQNGEIVIGPFMKFTDPAAVEIAGLAGFDFVIIDMEHGPVSYERAQDLIRAAELRNVTPVIRVPENKEIYIQRALDIGAHAVQVPQISNAKDAENVARASKFHPEGARGACRYVRAARYSSTPKAEYFSHANNDVITIIHIEGLEGIKNLEKIVKVPGIDIIFLGPYDLSQSCGVPGQTDHPEVIKKMTEAVELARNYGKVVGTFVESAEAVKKWSGLGVQYLSYSVDVGIYLQACSDIVSKARAVTGNIKLKNAE
jgi:4-hydroxy-2-oxoheptanedioate aldolase